MYKNKVKIKWNGGNIEIPSSFIEFHQAMGERYAEEGKYDARGAVVIIDVREADLVRALMSRYPGFCEYIASYGDINKQQIELMEEYSERNANLRKWYEEREERLTKRAADIKKLKILMGDLPKDK